MSQSRPPAADYLRCDATNRTSVRWSRRLSRRARDWRRRRSWASKRVKELELVHDGARGMGSFEWDFESGKARISPEMETLHGFAPGGFAGTWDALQELVHPDDRERMVGDVHPRRRDRRRFRNPVPDPPQTATCSGATWWRVSSGTRDGRPVADGRRRPRHHRARKLPRRPRRGAVALPAAGRAAPAGHLRGGPGHRQRHVHQPADRRTSSATRPRSGWPTRTSSATCCTRTIASGCWRHSPRCTREAPRSTASIA